MKTDSLGIFFIGLLVAIVLGIALRSTRKFDFCPVFVFWWIWLGFFIGFFEAYLFANRENLVQFSATSSRNVNPWLDIWHEYSAVADPRYIESASNIVHRIEFTNALVQFALVLVLFSGAAGLIDVSRTITLLIILLMVQFVNCVYYFVTLPRFDSDMVSSKMRLYLTISALWLVIPVFSILVLGRFQ